MMTREFPLRLLQEITDNFAEEHIIGSGGHGRVYKGVLADGEEIALKRLFPVHGLDDTEFRKKLNNLMRAQHPNITRLVGYGYNEKKERVKVNGNYVFAHSDEKVLCFEYLQGGSLDKHISDESRGLDWPTRFNIIKGICDGLNYLHNGSTYPIYHLNLKPENILLDKNVVPKIGGFSSSNLFLSVQNYVTIGKSEYMPPEFIERPQITPKYDVFSLGVIIIKIMVGNDGYFKCASLSSKEFLEHVHERWGKRLQATMSSYTSKQITTCAKIALMCVKIKREKRPRIVDIVDELKRFDTAESASTFQEEGGSGTLDRMASRGRAIPSASSTLETIILDKSAEPRNLPLALLQYITENFADKREIGRGGFGVVYKGDLENGSSVAVKKLLNSHTIEEKAFNHEASSLIGLNHKNIVRFLGYCANTEYKAMPNPESGALKYIFAEIRERLLCFEYINNGSLEQYLTDELKGLEWNKRYQIIRGICDGLVYLHKEKDIVHMDMKPANILLDDLMIPKITDFGISKLLEGATHAVTANLKWSLGYCAPEFISSGEVSTKSDIYSLGIIITELLTGCRDNLDIKHVLRRWRYRWNKSVNYPPFGYEQVKLCTEIALRCVSKSPRERPQIWDIVSMLDTIESMNAQINNANDSPVDLISPYPWELLDFDMLDLNFPFEINKQIPCSLQLTNVTDYYVAFDMKTEGRLQYSIEPEKGVVPPRSKCNVMVTLQAQERAPNATACKDEFFMRCSAVNEGVTAVDITEDMFDKKSGNMVDEVTLKVIIEPVANA